MIICAAVKIKYYDSKYNTQELIICGHRHGNCFETISKLDVAKAIEKTEGFINHAGDFLNRTDAYIHATQCGQLTQTTRWYKEDHGDRELYSEDLY